VGVKEGGAAEMNSAKRLSGKDSIHSFSYCAGRDVDWGKITGKKCESRKTGNDGASTLENPPGKEVEVRNSETLLFQISRWGKKGHRITFKRYKKHRRL